MPCEETRCWGYYEIISRHAAVTDSFKEDVSCMWWSSITFTLGLVSGKSLATGLRNLIDDGNPRKWRVSRSITVLRISICLGEQISRQIEKRSVKFIRSLCFRAKRQRARIAMYVHSVLPRDIDMLPRGTRVPWYTWLPFSYTINHRPLNNTILLGFDAHLRLTLVRR